MQAADIIMQWRGVVDYWREKVEEETKHQRARKGKYRQTERDVHISVLGFLQHIYRVNVVIVYQKGEVHVFSVTDCQQEGAWWNRSVDKRRELSEDQGLGGRGPKLSPNLLSFRSIKQNHKQEDLRKRQKNIFLHCHCNHMLCCAGGKYQDIQPCLLLLTT